MKHLPPPSLLLLLGSGASSSSGGGAPPRHRRDRRPPEARRRRLEEPYVPNLFDLAGHSIKFLGCRNLFGPPPPPEPPSVVLVEEAEGEEEETPGWLDLVAPPPVAAPVDGVVNGDGGARRRRRLEQPPSEPRAVVSFRFCPDGPVERPLEEVDLPHDSPQSALGGTGGGTCGSRCDSSEHGIMTVDMRTYLDIVMGFKEDEQGIMCERCNECHEWQQAAAAEGAAEDFWEGHPLDFGGAMESLDAVGEAMDMQSTCGDYMNLFGIDTSSCYAECENIQNMEANGYVDAVGFADCTPLDPAEDGTVYYAAATCDDGGSKIKIGFFSDEECTVQDRTKHPEDFILNEDGYHMKLSYHLLKEAFASDGECVASCDTDNDDMAAEADLGNVNGPAPAVNEVCSDLYDAYQREEYYEPAIASQEPPERPDHDHVGGWVPDPWGSSGEVCVNETGYYAGKDCQFKATSICSNGTTNDDDDQASGFDSMPVFCVNNGTCVEETFSVPPGLFGDDSLDDSLDDDALGILGSLLGGDAGDDDLLGSVLGGLGGHYCQCLDGYWGRYCEQTYEYFDDDAMIPVSPWDDFVDDDEGVFSSVSDYDDGVNYTVREREALVDFYTVTTTRGGSWANSQGWSSDTGVCLWFGVMCDAAGSVTHLKLGDNSIKGYFEGSSLARLGNLTVLDLSDNELFGTISADMGDLGRLVDLNLRNNDLRGSVPGSLSRLSKLESLDLHGNSLQTFPFDDFAYAWLDDLARVDIGSNEIAGTLSPRAFMGHPSLRYLDLSRNRLTGQIPFGIMRSAFEKERVEGQSGDPFVLDLSFNRFDENVPDFGENNLNINVVGNRLVDIDSVACGRDWNEGATRAFGCDGIACPVGTANSEGRQITGENPCVNCTSALFLGTVGCQEDTFQEEDVTGSVGDPFNLEGYDVEFVGCRNLFEEGVEKEESQPASVVTFRFCGGEAGCGGACDSSEHEEMTLDMRTYLRLVTKHNRELQVMTCERCFGCADIETVTDGLPDMEEAEFQQFQDAVLGMCGGDVDTSACIPECRELGITEENSYMNDVYMNPVTLAECQSIYTEDGELYYAGPMCSDEQIKIGVFTDEKCTAHDPTKDVEQLNADGRISYDSLDKTFASSGECLLGCHSEEYDWFAELSALDLPEYLLPESVPVVNEVCSELYEAYWREGYPTVESGAVDGDQNVPPSPSDVFNPVPDDGSASGGVGGGGGGGGGPFYATTSNYTATDFPSQAPSSQPSSEPSAETPAPTESPTEFVDAMAPDTNTGREAFPLTQKISLLLFPVVYCMTLMHG